MSRPYLYVVIRQVKEIYDKLLTNYMNIWPLYSLHSYLALKTKEQITRISLTVFHEKESPM